MSKGVSAHRQIRALRGYWDGALGSARDGLDATCLVRRDVPVADPHHPDHGRLPTFQPPRIGSAHCHSANGVRGWRPRHVLGARTVTRVEEARIPAVRHRFTGLQRQHGGPVVARMCHDLLHADDVLPVVAAIIAPFARSW